MSNGIIDVRQKDVFAIINGRDVSIVGKTGRWMPYGNEIDCTVIDTMYEIERAEDGSEKLINPEETTGQVEIQWSIEWDHPTPEYPNAIAHVHSYPGDYLSIGKYVHGKWIAYGGVLEDDRLLSGYSRCVLEVVWNDEHKHLSLPAISILTPSDSPTPGGKSEDIRSHLELNSYMSAQEKAFILIMDEYDKLRSDRKVGMGIECTHSDVHLFPGCIVYSFTYADADGYYPSLSVDIRMQNNPVDAAVRRPNEPLPEWATQEMYNREREKRSNLLNALFLKGAGDVRQSPDEFITGKTLLDFSHEVEMLGLTVCAMPVEEEMICVTKGSDGCIGYFNLAQDEPCFYFEEKPYHSIQETLTSPELASYKEKDLRALAAKPIWAIHSKEERSHFNELLKDMPIDL